MKRMLSYRTLLLAQTAICSGIHPMALRSIPPQSLASSISASTTSSTTVNIRTYPNQKPWITGNIRTKLKLPLSRSGTLNAFMLASRLDCKALQREVRTAQYITGAKLPAIPVTQVRDCSLFYRTAIGTGAPSLGSLTASTPKP